MADDFLSTPLQFVKGVGPRRASEFQRVGLFTVEDLLLRLPRRYEDRANVVAIGRIRAGERVTVIGEVVTSGIRPTRRPGFRLFELVIRDGSGVARAVFPNQGFLRDVFHPGQQVVLFGAVEFRQGLQISNPDYEILRDADDEAEETIHVGRVVPIYEKIGTLTPRIQRSIVHRVLEDMPGELPDPVPGSVRAACGLMPRAEAFRRAHFPLEGTPVDALDRHVDAAQQRLVFEEFFLFQAGLLMRRRRAKREEKSHRIVIDDRIRESARRVLPFKLTPGQRTALHDIVEDMKQPAPMHRLLQGDVGSGKTIVALIAAVVAMENGQQVAFMAPTEILADQHYLTIRKLLAESRFHVVSLTGSRTGARRRDILAEIGSGAAHLVVGTHALVEEAVRFHALGLVIIDEQHRFGVMQRAALRAKGVRPDVLVMTATPIPRTLALTTFGDLDVSTMTGVPPGRTPVRTIARSESRREEVYTLVRRALEAGEQAYVVYPLIEDSEKVDLKAATAMADHLQAEVFPEYRVALLHGRLRQDEKDRVMSAFAAGEVHVLVTTTVVEVGVDVPNASIMVIEHAERFGLSQLHQLRGRVGRGAARSTCVLVSPPRLAEPSRARIDALVASNDGFEIAERDLELRGPGDFFGTRQSGLPSLRVGDLVRDRVLLEHARQAAERWVNDEAAGSALAAYLDANWASRFGLVDVG